MVNIPNSMTVLTDLLPVSLAMADKKLEVKTSMVGAILLSFGGSGAEVAASGALLTSSLSPLLSPATAVVDCFGIAWFFRHQLSTVPPFSVPVLLGEIPSTRCQSGRIHR